MKLWTAMTSALLVTASAIVCVTVFTPERTEPEVVIPTEAVTETTLPTTLPTTEPTTLPTTEPTTEPPPPESVKLEIPYYSQRNVLPTGCELISAKMVLEYYAGEKISVDDIIDNMVCRYPKDIDGKPTAPHPENAFIGHPTDPSSFGCFAPVVTDMMNALLPEGYTAVDTTGTELQALAETYLPQETPVMIWATINMVSHEDYLGWYLEDEDGEPTDEWYDWQVNEHCLVLVGYDSEYYYFNDPNSWQSMTKFGRELVEKRYNSMGMYSIVVQESTEDDTEMGEA